MTSNNGGTISNKLSEATGAVQAAIGKMTGNTDTIAKGEEKKIQAAHQQDLKKAEKTGTSTGVAGGNTHNTTGAYNTTGAHNTTGAFDPAGTHPVGTHSTTGANTGHNTTGIPGTATYNTTGAHSATGTHPSTGAYGAGAGAGAGAATGAAAGAYGAHTATGTHGTHGANTGAYGTESTGKPSTMKGAAQEAVGATKEKTGKAMHKPAMTAEGRQQRMVGKANRAAGKHRDGRTRSRASSISSMSSSDGEISDHGRVGGQAQKFGGATEEKAGNVLHSRKMQADGREERMEGEYNTQTAGRNHGVHGAGLAGTGAHHNTHAGIGNQNVPSADAVANQGLPGSHGAAAVGLGGSGVPGTQSGMANTRNVGTAGAGVPGTLNSGMTGNQNTSLTGNRTHEEHGRVGGQGQKAAGAFKENLGEATHAPGMAQSGRQQRADGEYNTLTGNQHQVPGGYNSGAVGSQNLTGAQGVTGQTGYGNSHLGQTGAQQGQFQNNQIDPTTGKPCNLQNPRANDSGMPHVHV